MDKIYNIYNSFDATMAGLLKVALIYGNSGYLVLVTIFAIAGIGIGAMVATGSAAMGTKKGYNSYLISIVAGLVFYSALAIPTGILHVYDRSTNQTQDIELPLFVVALVGTLNEIETSIIDIIESTPTYVSVNQNYINNAGGLSYHLINTALLDVASAMDLRMTQNLQSYTDNCYIISLGLTGGPDITDLNSNLDSMFAPAPNAGFTEWNAPGVTETVSCDEAAARINNYFVTTGVDDINSHILNVCSRSGFNVANPVALQRCRDGMSAATPIQGGATGMATEADMTSLLKNSYISQAVLVSLAQGDTAGTVKTLTDKNMQAQNLGIAEMANEWLPMIKGTIIAISFALAPLVGLLIVTPLFGRALVYIVGIFTWIVVWNIVDAVTHSFATDFALRVIDSIKHDGIGMQEILTMPDVTMKCAGLFAKAKSASIVMSTTLVYALFKFGGIAFANSASQQSEAVQSEGARNGMTAGTPEGQGQIFNGLSSANAVFQSAVANSGQMSPTNPSGSGMGSLMNSQAANMSANAATTNQVMKNAGGHIQDFTNFISKAGAQEQTARGDTAQKVEDQFGGDTRHALADTSISKAIPQIKAIQDGLSEMGGLDSFNNAQSKALLQNALSSIFTASGLSDVAGNDSNAAHMLSDTAVTNARKANAQAGIESDVAEQLGKMMGLENVSTFKGKFEAAGGNWGEFSAMIQSISNVGLQSSSGNAIAATETANKAGVSVEQNTANTATRSYIATGEQLMNDASMQRPVQALADATGKPLDSDTPYLVTTKTTADGQNVNPIITNTASADTSTSGHSGSTTSSGIKADTQSIFNALRNPDSDAAKHLIDNLRNPETSESAKLALTEAVAQYAFPDTQITTQDATRSGWDSNTKASGGVGIGSGKGLSGGLDVSSGVSSGYSSIDQESSGTKAAIMGYVDNLLSADSAVRSAGMDQSMADAALIQSLAQFSDGNHKFNTEKAFNNAHDENMMHIPATATEEARDPSGHGVATHVAGDVMDDLSDLKQGAIKIYDQALEAAGLASENAAEIHETLKKELAPAVEVHETLKGALKNN